jgi:hypothetical protein
MVRFAIAAIWDLLLKCSSGRRIRLFGRSNIVNLDALNPKYPTKLAQQLRKSHCSWPVGF